jgi:ubiquinone/menaquinone biosynthesis C-methylase UbiE
VSYGKEEPLREVDYDERQYRVYAQARALSEATLAGWMRIFARHAPQRRPLSVLDLGSGTGRFTPALAATFGGPVYGVEPSERMRSVAEEHTDDQAVTYLDGSAEAIPLPGASCDLVLMFLVFHHVRDQAAAAAEVARVLRPGGRLLIRSAFPERLPELLWYDYFPGARVIDEKIFPRMDHTIDLFTAAGLEFVTLDEAQEQIADSLADYADRLRLRGSSTFERLTEEEIEAGFAALDVAVAAESRPRPVIEDSDILVFERGRE